MSVPRRAAGPKPTSSHFAENLRALRGDQSQTAFAEWLMVSQQTLSFWENGLRRPNPRTWLVLEQRLGFTQFQLEQGKLPEPGNPGVAETPGAGHTIALPPLHTDALCIRLGGGLATEGVTRVEAQRLLREALRERRPVWLVVGEKPKGAK